jgi:hypothetical protein
MTMQRARLVPTVCLSMLALPALCWCAAGDNRSSPVGEGGAAATGSTSGMPIAVSPWPDASVADDGVESGAEGGILDVREAGSPADGRVAACDASVLVAGDGCAPPAPIETLIVPTDGGVVHSHNAYPAPSSVRVVASGSIVWGTCNPAGCPDAGACMFQRIGDAKYISDDCFASTYTTFAGTEIGLFMNGGPVSWGPYSPTHIYSAIVSGTNAPLAFHYNDCSTCYGDNSGSFSVRIFAK